MPDLTAYLEEEATLPNLCPVGRILRDLPKAQRTALEARLTETGPGRISNEAIRRALTRAGMVTSKGSIADHRGGTCRCRT